MKSNQFKQRYHFTPTEIQKIKEIMFTKHSPSFFKENSAKKIVNDKAYDTNNKPYMDGAMSPYLGVSSSNATCKTCKLKGGKNGCIGHFGHIDLAMPVIHAGFKDDIQKCLYIICERCGHVLLTKEEKEKYFAILEEKRTQNIDKTHILNTIFEKCKKVKVCPHCGATKCKIKITVTPDGFTFDPSWIRIWLEKIPDAELPLLGLSPERSRPEWMVLTKLPILPTTMRPSKRGESGEISVDGLTRKISKIIQFNRELQELRDSGSPHIIVEDKWIELNDEVKSYINSIKYRIENSIYNPREDNYLSDDEKAIQEEKNPLLKNVILTLLPYFDNKKAKEILIRSVSQGDIIERCNAARMLKYIRDNEIVKRLKDCLTTETDEKVKYYISNTINTTPTFNEKTLIDNTISNANISMETLSQLIINKQEQDILLKDDNIKKLSEKIYPNKECEIFDLIASIYLEKSGIKGLDDNKYSITIKLVDKQLNPDVYNKMWDRFEERKKESEMRLQELLSKAFL